MKCKERENNDKKSAFMNSIQFSPNVSICCRIEHTGAGAEDRERTTMAPYATNDNNLFHLYVVVPLQQLSRAHVDKSLRSVHYDFSISVFFPNTFHYTHSLVAHTHSPQKWNTKILLILLSRERQIGINCTACVCTQRTHNARRARIQT